jgi:hypothetical protein
VWKLPRYNRYSLDFLSFFNKWFCFLKLSCCRTLPTTWLSWCTWPWTLLNSFDLLLKLGIGHV